MPYEGDVCKWSRLWIRPTPLSCILWAKDLHKGNQITVPLPLSNNHDGRHLCLIPKRGREQAKQAHIPRRLEQRARGNGADYHFIRLEKRPSARPLTLLASLILSSGPRHRAKNSIRSHNASKFLPTRVRFCWRASHVKFERIEI